MEIIFFAMILIASGNVVLNPALGVNALIENEYVLVVAHVLYRTGQFLIVNFPVLFLLRFATRKKGGSTSVLCAFIGYIAYLVATMFFAPTGLPNTAFSSILGLSFSNQSLAVLGNAARYPLQTGVIGVAVVSLVTLWSFNRSRNRNEYGIFAFISKESSVAFHTVLYCILAGIGVAYVWKYFLMAVTKVVTFVSADTVNPINLSLYGVTDRVLSVLNLNSLIRQPFWYQTNGGTWINLAGSNIAGDASIWANQISSNVVTGISGRFFTPYFVLNIFLIPSIIWGMYSLYTDAIERRKIRMLCVMATITSLFGATMLPLELMMAFLCPLLFILYVGYTGILFAVLHVFRAYLGYIPLYNATIIALPGTLLELMKYMQYPSMERSYTIVMIAGTISIFVGFFATRIYFKFLAVDLFKTGEKDRLIQATIKAVGGIENVKMLQSSISTLTINVYDPNRTNFKKLKKFGSYHIYESRAGYNISFGAASTMIRIGMNNAMREAVRAVNQ